MWIARTRPTPPSIARFESRYEPRAGHETNHIHSGRFGTIPVGVFSIGANAQTLLILRPPNRWYAVVV